MANSSDVPILNPFTHMAFLPPDQAYERTITEYVVVGGLSVLIWDILTHLHADYELLTRHRIRLPTATYFLSRWSTLAYAITTTIFLTTPVDNCVALVKAKCVVYHLSASSTALLFFFRVRAIFDRNGYITAGFFCLWLTVSGGSFSAIVSISGAHIGPTRYCAFADIKSYLTALANITLALFDSCILIAITWRLSTSVLSVERDTAFRKRQFDLLGKYLPAFSRALLQDGQKYYMVATLANLLVLIMEFVPGIALPYRAIFLAPAMELTNIMGCRVFRRTRKGRVSKDTHVMSTIRFQKGDNAQASTHIQTSDLTMDDPTAGNELHGSSLTGKGALPRNSCSSVESDRISKGEVSVISLV